MTTLVCPDKFVRIARRFHDVMPGQVFDIGSANGASWLETA